MLLMWLKKKVKMYKNGVLKRFESIQHCHYWSFPLFGNVLGEGVRHGISLSILVYAMVLKMNFPVVIFFFSVGKSLRM